MKKLFLAFILLIAFILRFYQLGENPPSLTWDETAWGYNAYSLGIDGRDEFGRFLPLDYLESFGDFKPPFYAYLDIIPVKVFGLNEFAVRFPSALFGVLTVLVTYFLVIKLFDNHRTKQTQTQNYAEKIGLISALILAISPWHIMLSRAAFEANVATFFIVLGIWLFLEAIEKNKWLILLSVVSFALSLYTFNTARVFVPLLLLILAIGFRSLLFEFRKQTFFAFILAVLLLLPAFKFFLTPQASLRFKEVNIFSDIKIVETANKQIQNDNNAFWSKIIHNRRLAYSAEFIKHYFDNLSPSFLFIRGDGNPKFSTQDVGQLYLWELPFFIAGILYLFRKKEGYWWIIPLWLIIGIFPSATARETPHALRIETTLPTFQILTAYGLFFVFRKVSYLRYLIFSFIFLFFIFNILYYLHGYYAHYKREFSQEWQYGYKEAIAYVQSVEKDYEKIVFTEELGRPYIYFLFHTKYDPKKFRSEAVVEREVFGFVHVRNFDKYVFTKDFSSFKKGNNKTLFVNTPSGVAENAEKLKTFYLLNGNPILVAYR